MAVCGPSMILRLDKTATSCEARPKRPQHSIARAERGSISERGLIGSVEPADDAALQNGQRRERRLQYIPYLRAALTRALESPKGSMAVEPRYRRYRERAKCARGREEASPSRTGFVQNAPYCIVGAAHRKDLIRGVARRRVSDHLGCHAHHQSVVCVERIFVFQRPGQYRSIGMSDSHEH